MEEREFNLTCANYGTVRKENYDMAILPWGATEPHNLHLPYLTDCILAQRIALDAAQLAFEHNGVRAMVMHPIPMGSQNPGQWTQPFCIHTRYETQKAILTDIIDSLHKQGLRKLILINGHGGNCFKPMIRDLAVDYPDFTIASADWFSIVDPKGYFENKDDHAGELETSVMMYYHPEWVRLEEAGEGRSNPSPLASLNDKTAWMPRNWNTTTVDTGIGDPRKASIEKGKRYAQEVVSRIGKLIEEIGQL